MKTTTVTEEQDAGACGLTGEELTAALLEENRRLLARNAELNNSNQKLAAWLLGTLAFIGFGVLILTLALYA